MKAIKQYGWLIQIVGAALLIGLALFLEFGDGEGIVVPFVGAVIIISACIRLVPFIKTQHSDLIKTVNIIEITIDVAIGLALIIIQLFTEIEFGTFFGILLGVYLMLRGSVHFFSTSSGQEKSDLPLYFFHIAALIIGSYVFFVGDFTPAILIHIILLISIGSGGYLSYGGYKGYKTYRYQKTLMMPDSDDVADEDTDEIKVPATDRDQYEEPVQDHVN